MVGVGVRFDRSRLAPFAVLAVLCLASCIETSPYYEPASGGTCEKQGMPQVSNGRVITVDGEGSDWDGINCYGSDSVGDAIDDPADALQASSNDIDRVCVAADASNLYVLWTLASGGSFSPNYQNGTNPPYRGSYRIQLSNDGPLYDVTARIAWNNAGDWTVLADAPQSGGAGNLNPALTGAGAAVQTNTMELKIPWTALGDPTTLTHFEALVWDGGQSRALDESPCMRILQLH